MPTAKKIVPNPIIPPNHQPIVKTVISIMLRTQAIGKPVTLCRPVIKPSLAPGPKFAIKYMPPPNPVIKTPKRACITLKIIPSKVGKKGIA